jgi:hypothetical protein
MVSHELGRTYAASGPGKNPLPGRSSLVKGEMDWNWQKIVARFAAAEMNRPICGCQEANRELYNWQYDLSRAGGRAEEQYKVSDEELNNPFGHRRGHVYAWERIKESGFSRGMIF